MLCKAITKRKVQCNKEARLEGFCTQHYKICFLKKQKNGTTIKNT